jgi:hypothetical protein
VNKIIFLLVNKLYLILKSSELYIKYIKIVKAKNANLIYPDDQGVSLCIEGYQRSGNSFVKNIIKQAFPHEKVGAMKVALRMEKNLVVILREPSNAISSSILKSLSNGKSEEVALKALDEYINFYSFVLQNNSKIKVFEFQKITDEPLELINYLSELLGNDYRFSKAEIEKMELNSIERIKSRPQMLGDTGWRSDYKESKKKEIIDKIRLLDKYKSAEELYNKFSSNI